MNKRIKIIIVASVAIICIVVASLVALYNKDKNQIISIIMTSPNNTAMYNQIKVTLAHPDPVYIDYEEVATGKKFRTRTSPAAKVHRLDLLLLKANTKYTYRVVVANFFHQKSIPETFTTRKQSSWLVNHWLSTDNPHDAKALGNGMIMICNARLPGYIIIIDGEGQVRWYWQIEGIGVRSAILTPRGTLLCMLRPFNRDVRDSTTIPKQFRNRKDLKPMRRGPIGFVGGTQFCEVTLTGKMLWRLDLKKVEKDKQFQVVHHDFFMDKKGLIHTLYRPDTIVNVTQNGKTVRDTLNGDGFMVIDSLGHVLKTWSAWKHWDMKHDPYMAIYGHDRFHMNGLIEAPDGNYLLSVAIEDQIWKVDKNTGKILWKFGRNGNFKMDKNDYFSFQHDPIFSNSGIFTIFDNGLYTKRSAVRGFMLDENEMKARTVLRIILPPELFSSRMGSAYIMPNDNVLISCAKKGAVIITNRDGNILWESLLYYDPYRAVYIPKETWDPYFKALN
jgi:arylsulfate sulfotransferase